MRAVPSRASISKLRRSGVAAQTSQPKTESSERPVISAGWSIPSRSSAVGATSARMPPSRRSTPRAGDDQAAPGWSSARCSGEPSGSSMWSALPWSAVTMQRAADSRAPPRPPRRGTRPRPRPPATAAGITPVWPTMSGFAKLMIAERGDRRPCQPLDEGVGGRARRSSRASGRRWRRRGASRRGSAPPPPTPPRGRR